MEQQYEIKDYMQWSSEIHNIIEDELRIICQPGAKVIDIVLHIENRIDELTTQYVLDNGLNDDFSRGKAFPVGININNIAAHWSPLTESDCNRIIEQLDVVTIDYGIHFNGYILDAAFSFAYDEKHRNLLECGLRACQDTASIVKSGISIYTLSKNIMKIAKQYKFGLIRDLCGHQIGQYKIHDGFVIPNCDMNLKKTVTTGSLFTIEPFISNKKGTIKYTTDISHYMFNYHAFNYDKLVGLGKIPYFLIKYGTLAFNRRHIDSSFYPILDKLVTEQIYQAYPPIIETDTNAYVCQFETTLYVESDTNVINYKQHNDINSYLLIAK